MFTGFMAGLVCLASCGDGDAVPPVTPDPPEPTAPAAIEISLLDVSEHDFAVRLVPDEHTASYSYAIGGPDDAAAFASGALEGIKTVQGNSAQTALFDGLDNAADYTVYASARNADGAVCEPVVLEVRTLAGRADVEITLENNAGTSITAAFVPNEYAASFSYAVGTEHDRDAFASGTLEGIREGAETVSEDFGNLVPLTRYAVFARGINRDGEEGEVCELAVTTADVPYLYVDFTGFNCAYAKGTMRFGGTCTGANAFFVPAEEFAGKLEPFGGDTAAMMRALPWQEPGEKAFEALSPSCVPEESRFVAAASLWTGDQERAGWQCREFTAPGADPSLPLPGKPAVEYLPAGAVLIIRLYGDQNTAALKAVHIRRSLYESIGDEGVAALLDEAPFGWYNQVYTDVFATDRGDNVCSFAVPYNANGAEGRASEVYFYEFSLEQGVQVNVSVAGNAGPLGHVSAAGN